MNFRHLNNLINPENLQLQKRVLILSRLILILGVLLGLSSEASALPDDVRDETCLQLESQQGGIKDCKDGFNAGYQVGVNAGRTFRQNSSSSQPSEPDVEKEFGDSVTTSYKEGYLSGYRVGFQEGYGN